MASRAELVTSRSLRALLEPLAWGDPLPEGETLERFLGGLARLLTERLADEHPWWHGQTLERVTLTDGRKARAREVSLYGVGALAPGREGVALFVRARHTAGGDELEAFECGVGLPGDGDGGMERAADPERASTGGPDDAWVWRVGAPT